MCRGNALGLECFRVDEPIEGEALIQVDEPIEGEALIQDHEPIEGEALIQNHGREPVASVSTKKLQLLWSAATCVAAPCRVLQQPKMIKGRP